MTKLLQVVDGIKKILTVNQYAVKVGVTPQTVRDWCNAGKIEVERTPPQEDIDE